MAEPVDVLVDLGVLLDKRVRARDVRLRLVVVVVGDEVLHGVVREELGELAGELGRERLVVRDHERGPPDLLDDPGHRVRLARPRNPEERLRPQPRVQTGGELLYGLRLVAGRPVLAVHLKCCPGLYKKVLPTRGLKGPKGRLYRPTPTMRLYVRTVVFLPEFGGGPNGFAFGSTGHHRSVCRRS